MKSRKKNENSYVFKSLNLRKEPPHYLLRETDLERIDSLVGALNLAIQEVFNCRKFRERPGESTPALEDFDSQIELVLTEADHQLKFPWNYSSDF